MNWLFRKWRGFWRQPPQVRRWFLPAWLLLGVFRARILRQPFRDLAKTLGDARGTASVLPLLTPDQVSEARWIARVVVVASRYTPWESNCFPQALLARFLLERSGLPYALFFGVAKGEGAQALTAHAWVAAGPVAVSGGYSFDQYAVVGVYVSRGWLESSPTPLTPGPSRG